MNIFQSYVFLFLLLSSSIIYAQSGKERFLKPSDTLNKSRKSAVIIAESGIMGMSLLGLSTIWYDDFSRSKFHTYNDWEEWNQIDKIGHVYSAYQLARLSSDAFNWAGTSKKEQLLYGAGASLLFLSSIEVLDGFSDEWGFSWYDFGSNAVGVGLFVGQDLLWNEQRIGLKYSFNRTDFPDLRPDVLGSSFTEELFKDYNAQTYWLSFNMASFVKSEKIPGWLNLAIGFGANGMISGRKGDEPHGIEGFERSREFYISLDLDLSRIKTNSHLLKTIFSVFNSIKIPMPTVEFSNRNRTRFHLLYF